MVQIQRNRSLMTGGNCFMKATAKQRKVTHAKRSRKTRKTLEDAYRQMFVGPTPNAPAKERLSMYKSVPSVTTYGLCEKPA
jgi:hypothetical protein